MKPNILESDLKRLYITENKTDKEIASLFSISAFSVWNLRKKYGIHGINARYRKQMINPQIPITSRQMEIILGSLLGDCCIKGKARSAYLSISHTIKHKEYVDWLYNELKSICLSFPKQYISKGKYITYWFITESREDLKDLRNKIYTPTKRVSEWWINQITPLGLAIWFMDDGSMTYVNKSKYMYSFATNSFTEEENYMLAKMLKTKFDLNVDVKPCNKKTGMQYNLFISDDSFDKFTHIISPYILSCMKYKTPCDINKEHWLENIECKINRETIDRLYNQELFTQEQIAKLFNVHKSTIRRYMHLFNIEPRNNVDSQIGGKNNKNPRSSAGQFMPLILDKDGEQKAQEIFKEMRSSSFPYIPIKQPEYYVGILDRLCNLEPLTIIDGTTDIYSRSAMDICSAYCPQIFSMSAVGSLSPVEIFNNDETLLDCIRRTIRYAHKDSISAVRQGLKTYRKNRCVTMFPPMWAKTAIKYCFNDRLTLSMLDFSCGFGGRLIGGYASSVSKYWGIDPLQANIDSHIDINKIIQKHASLKGIVFESNFIKGTAEDVLPSIDTKFDIILTSPPYFNKEHYGKDDSQCYIKHKTYGEWKEKWMDKILRLSFDRLNPNGAMIVFASNYDKYNVGFDCRDIMRNIGKSEPICLKFGLPSLEYFRSKDFKKYDTAWIIRK